MNRSRKHATELEVPLIERGKSATASLTSTAHPDTVVEWSCQRPSGESGTLLDPSDDKGFTKWCVSMGFTKDLLAQHDIGLDDLQALYRRDTAPTRLPWLQAHWLRPRSLTYMPERLWLMLTMPSSWISKDLGKRSWVWIRGIAIPLVSTKGYGLKLMMSNLWQGGLTGFKMTLHGILVISLGIQLRKVIDEHPEDILSTWRDGDSTTWKQLIYDATGTSARLFWPLIFAPTMVMALAQMVLQTSRTLARGQGRLVQLTATLNRILERHSVWSSWVRPHLPFDQASFLITNLSDQLAFDGRVTLTPTYRQHATRYLNMALKQTQGLHRLAALKALASLSIGTHILNLRHDHGEGAQPATSLSHLHIRIAAMQTLESFMQTEGAGPREWLYREWAHYQCWTAGRNTPALRIVAYVTMNVALTAYFFYGFRVMIEALQAYLPAQIKQASA